MKTIKSLIEILHDKQLSISERDDAAMDLGNSDDPLALEALIAKGRDAAEDDLVLSSCGESLAEIWIRNNNFDQVLYESLMPKAKHGVRCIIESTKDELKALYKL